MSYDPKTSTITVGPDSDFIVDSGLHFVHILLKISEDANTPAKLKEDGRTLKKWLGCELDNFSQADEERISTAWRAYLNIGVAPSLALQPIFDTAHKQGLQETSFQSCEKPPTEIMDVFDRMLASKGEILAKRAYDLQVKKGKSDFESRTSAKEKSVLIGFLALGYSKLHPGLMRLWILITVLWLVFCTSQLYVNHRDWESGMAAAHVSEAAIESQRQLFIQNYMFDAKAAFQAAKNRDIMVGAFDEAQTRDQAYSYSQRKIEHSEERKQVNQLYRDAFDSRDKRDSLLPWVPTVPVGTALLFVAIPWVIRGFRKEKLHH